MSSKFPSRRNKLHSNKPYDRPKTFLQKVTSTVSDYLPSWLNPSSWGLAGDQLEANPNSVANDDETGEETEEELDAAGHSGLTVPRREIDPAASVSTLPSFTRRPLQRNSPPPELLNGDDHSDNSETSASTSGCSSLAPTQERRHSASGGSQLKGLQVSKNHLEHIQQQLSTSTLFTLPGKQSLGTGTQEPRDTTQRDQDGSFYPRVRDKTQKKVTMEQCKEKSDKETCSTQTSLWHEDFERNVRKSRAVRPQPVAPNQRPCFSISAFGSPLTVSDERKRSTADDSPFYKGQTTYGGASAYKKARLGTPYSSGLHADAIKVRKNSSKEVLSSAAQKVLTVLENMSTPLTDANKIPVEQMSTDFALAFTPSVYARKPLRGNAFTTPLARDKPVNVPQTSTQSSFSSGGPLRTKVVQSMRESKRQPDMNEPPLPEPDLPNIPLLGMTSRPSLSFSIPKMTSTPIAEAHQSAKTANQSAPIVRQKTVNETAQITRQGSDLLSNPKTPVFGQGFKFSSPIENRFAAGSTLTPEVKNFKFRSPVFVDQKDDMDVTVTTQQSTSPTVNFSFSIPAKVNHTSPLRKRTMEESSNDLESTSLKPASELIIGGSVMDILGIPSTKTTTTEKSDKAGFGSAFQKKSGEWECNICMVRNGDDAPVCVSCTSARPSMQPCNKPLTLASSIAGFGAKFAPPSGSWCCPTCMVNNSGASVACVACGEANPKATTTTIPAASNVTFKSDKGFLKPFSTSGTWECDTCMVRNTDGTTKCCACETLKPNSSKTDTSGSFSGFKFGQKSSDKGVSFKFGLPTASDSSNIKNTPFGVSETSKVSQGFKFGVSSDSGTNDAKVSDSFKFGFPVNKPSAGSDSMFKFGISASDKEKDIGTTKELPSLPQFPNDDKTSTDNSVDNVNKTSFVFGGQSVSTDKVAETSPTLTFGQTTSNTLKSATTEEVVELPVSQRDTQKTSNVFTFNSSGPATTISQQSTTDTFRQNPASDCFKAGKLPEPKLVASITADTEKPSATPTLNIDYQRPSVMPGKQAITLASSMPANVLGIANGKSKTELSNQPSSTAITGFPQQNVLPTSLPNSGAAATGGFVFGVSKPVQANAPTNTGGFTFTFGNTATGGTPAPYQFGGTPSSATSDPTPSLFTFGKPSTPASSTFSFGATTTATFGATTTATFGTATQSSANPSIFGTQAKPSNPVFGSFSEPSSVPATATVPAVPSFVQQQQQQSSTGISTKPFQFGTNYPSATSDTFQASVPSSGTNSVFKFGTPQGNTATTQPMFGAPQPQGAMFLFGSPALPAAAPEGVSSTSAETAPFVFGSGISGNSPAMSAAQPFGVQPDANPFNVPSGAGQRVIRKAVRRVLKKK